MRSYEQLKLSQQLAGVLEGCVERGMEAPFHMAVVALNGSVLVARYVLNTEGLSCTILAEHFERPAFTLPINIMIVDAVGEAARVTIE